VLQTAILAMFFVVIVYLLLDKVQFRPLTVEFTLPLTQARLPNKGQIYGSHRNLAATGVKFIASAFAG
jgi:hypothetical protein